MFSTSHIEISKSALQNNYHFLRQLIGENVTLSSVVKGNAYGHGLENFIPLAESCGASHFSVFSADEAFEVQKLKKENSQIMILGMIGNEELEWAIRTSIEVYMFDLERLEVGLQIAQKMQMPIKIHLEMETGMNRIGIAKKDIPKVFQLLTNYPNCYILEGISTHYAGAESIANYVRVKQQIINYKKIVKRFQRKENPAFIPKKYHTACSAATIAYPQTRMDMVRIGILQYGFFPTQETLIQYLKDNKTHIDPLKRVLSWKSKIMTIKDVEAGEFIGYGTSFLASQKMKIAIVPVGYAHGYSRSLSNMGRVLVRGERMAVVGVVNMNLMIIDLEKMQSAEIGDEVILIGKQGEQEVSVASFSEMSNQLNYELLTRLPMNIPRKIVE
ncbi:alanine racemase [Bernardetia litoralis DSM 6794]|uniref:Alanine racemase n=1 Tax=Bernardetia litoralis (strain ATCC 23117 / DSM 6794 / NBRC 15988 / NCIMB 1366 / Fx l1 / Sio-4) TaxID=880071 RepID=I4AH93_BERLS|nr:alanine racemase [Bernardetia litoralis]AFM03328.1 alanine racemase [Bernardetia litoralis DSM 6794]